MLSAIYSCMGVSGDGQEVLGSTHRRWEVGGGERYWAKVWVCHVHHRGVETVRLIFTCEITPNRRYTAHFALVGTFQKSVPSVRRLIIQQP